MKNKSKKQNSNWNPSLLARAKAHRTEKALGQCFLLDSNILDAIVEAADLDAEQDTVVEIGPGLGFMTERLLPLARRLYAVELDEDVKPYLLQLQTKFKNFSFCRGDILQVGLQDLFQQSYPERSLRYTHDEQASHSEPELQQSRFFGDFEQDLLPKIAAGDLPKIKVIANIPYQITTKILLHLLGEIGEPSPNLQYISEINLMVQKEFADRIFAQPGEKAYSAITLLVNNWAEPELITDVPNVCFRPSPRVDSSFISLKLRHKPLCELQSRDREQGNSMLLPPKKLRTLIKAIFANRRKTLSNGLKAAGYDKNKIAALELGNLRGETLSLREIVDLLYKLEA